jgi:hypothetical protein
MGARFAGGEKLVMGFWWRGSGAVAAAGKTVRAEVVTDGVPVPVGRVVFAAPGAGWIDQTGRLVLTGVGKVEIATLVNGQAATLTLNVTGDGRDR